MTSESGSSVSTQGTVLIVDVEVGDKISEGQRVALLESMKMEHEVLATSGGVITKVCIEIGQMVAESEKAIFL
ncbi:MAG: hypothetical protein CM15mP49_16820 [Actinomycetota bacterium]|nr:MAG: hypothetical protein CM15mP49_16820 [Actinomycetota bacterium]